MKAVTKGQLQSELQNTAILALKLFLISHSAACLLPTPKLLLHVGPMVKENTYF